jgi:PmbA protein
MNTPSTSAATEPAHLEADLLEEAADALAIAKAAGADDVAVRIGQGRSLEFDYRDGSLEKVQESATRALSVSLYVDGRYSRHQSNDLRATSLKPFLEQAVALTRALEPDPHRQLPDPALYADRSTADLDLWDPSVEAFTREDALTWLEAMDARTHADERVISASAHVSASASTSAMLTTNGFSGTVRGTSGTVFAEATVRDEGDKRPESYSYARARHLSDLPEAAMIGDEALSRALARLGSGKAPSARTTLVLDNRAVGTLLGPLLGALSGGAIQQERSFLKGSLGKRVASDLLVLTDDPLMPRALASRPYDGEGISARARPIIDAGTLRTFFIDTYYGRKLGVAPTTGGTTNVRFELGEKDCAALIAGVDDGIYLTDWAGGNSDGTNGDFSFGMRGNVIKGGKIGAPIGEMNVTGNYLDLLNKLVAVGNDPYPYSALQSPTLVFEDVNFSGA